MLRYKTYLSLRALGIRLSRAYMYDPTQVKTLACFMLRSPGAPVVRQSDMKYYIMVGDSTIKNLVYMNIVQCIS